MDKGCAVYRTVDFLSKRWMILIVLELYKGDFSEKRYSELKRSLPGITPKILSERLKDLEVHKVIVKKVDTKSIPMKCTYSLTKTGNDFIKVIKGIKKWGLTLGFGNSTCTEVSCKNCKD